MRRLSVRLQVALHHGSFQERLAAHIARDAIQHEVLRPVLVKVRPLVEPLAALEAVETVLGAAAFCLIDGLRYPWVTVAEVLRVVRVGVVLRLAREAMSLQTRMRRSEVVQVGALVIRIGEADDAGEDAGTPMASGIAFAVLVQVRNVRIV